MHFFFISTGWPSGFGSADFFHSLKQACLLGLAAANTLIVPFGRAGRLGLTQPRGSLLHFAPAVSAYPRLFTSYSIIDGTVDSSQVSSTEDSIQPLLMTGSKIRETFRDRHDNTDFRVSAKRMPGLPWSFLERSDGLLIFWTLRSSSSSSD